MSARGTLRNSIILALLVHILGRLLIANDALAPPSMMAPSAVGELRPDEMEIVVVVVVVVVLWVKPLMALVLMGVWILVQWLSVMVGTPGISA
jgi:hypothetical protein